MRFPKGLPNRESKIECTTLKKEEKKAYDASLYITYQNSFDMNRKS